MLSPKIVSPDATLPAAWLPLAHPSRIIVHWTAGGYVATDDDCQHYHFVVQEDGSIRRGAHSIASNDSTGDGVYAAHTRGLNTKSIGVAVACMKGACERPFDAGQAPLTLRQWQACARLVAKLSAHYGIKVTAHTVLSHAEVQDTLHVQQRGKWDINVLPWAPLMAPREVHEQFREMVRNSVDASVTGAA
jgi:N-acetyl-anhydromuramyl-L-alanine amidase AmpD